MLKHSLKGETDRNVVRQLSRVSRANDDCLLELQFNQDTAHALKDFHAAIRNGCAHGKAVLVKGWSTGDGDHPFSVDGIAAMRDNCSMSVEWQGQYL